MNCQQPEPAQAAHRAAHHGQQHWPQSPKYPFSPYVSPNPDLQLPPHYSYLMPNVPLAEPPWSQQAERLDNPQFFRWGAPIAPPLAHMPNPQPLAIMPPPAAGPRDWHQDQGDAFPEAVPHNMDKWPWNMDNNNLPVAPDVARLKFAMRRPPKQRQKQDHRTGLPRYHSLMLAPRPPDWRPDFPMRSTGLFRRLSRIREPRSARAVVYTLNRLLLYTGPDTYPISYDLRQEPEVIDITFMNLARPANSLDFCQLATSFPVDELCLWHRRFPWYIHIQASQSNGITIQDVLCQMYNQLAETLTDSDYWTAELSARDREEIWAACLFRTAENHQRKHMTRMDFLKFDCVFLGLAKSKDGMWEIKTREATP